jgi:antitoxin (DNA-binding transcriptional repressor) of toxin-antitoxin stability system
MLDDISIRDPTGGLSSLIQRIRTGLDQVIKDQGKENANLKKEASSFKVKAES